jgi:hypothetical protein
MLMRKDIFKLFWIVLFVAGTLTPAFSSPQEPGRSGKITIPKDLDPISAVLARAGNYLDREMRSAINGLKGAMLDVTQKHYVYGAYYCLLLDRFFPSWKQVFFKNNRNKGRSVAHFVIR